MIIIEPCFAEGHILEAHIRNICELFKPEHFILCEGMFPTGPEDSLRGARMAEFKSKYTLDGIRSWDLETMKDAVSRCQADYPGTDIRMIEMNYDPAWDTRATYYHAYVDPVKELGPGPDDVVFPLESDLLFTSEQAATVEQEIAQTSRNGQFGLSMYEYFESPRIRCDHTRERRGPFRYGDGRLYDTYFTDYYYRDALRYRKMMPTWVHAGWHYAWMRPGRYFDMRIEQTHKHGQTDLLRAARADIRAGGPDLQQRLKRYNRILTLLVTDLKIEDHPEHIRGHEKFKEYYECT